MGLMSLFKKAPSEVPHQVEVAWSESSMYTNADFPKYNPDDLIGAKGYAIYRKMMRDEQVKAVVRFKRDAITSRDWEFTLETEELSEDEKTRRKELFKQIVLKMEAPFSDALNGIMSGMYNGFSLTEKLYKQIIVGGKTWVGVKKLKLRPADTFFFHVDEFGNVEKVTQKYEMKEQEINLETFIHYVQNPDYDEHYGASELREAYRAWFSKDMVIKFQNIHMERFAAGFVWAAPVNGKTIVAGSAEYTTLQNVMQNLQATSSLILPSNIELNFEHPATTDIFERAVVQHDKAIAKSLLVPNLMGVSEQGRIGSYSQSETQLEAFLWTLDADAARLEAVINTQLFKELGDYNFGDGVYPIFKFKPVSDTRKLEIVKIWTQLVTSGAVQATETDEKFIRQTLEVPQKPAIEGDAPDLVLNGSQVLAIVDIVSKVGTGIMTPDAAKALITAVFPIKEEQAAKMVENARATGPTAPAKPQQTGEPAAPAAGKPAAPQNPAAVMQDETIVGKMGISVSAFSSAMKRVDFAVIGNKADNLSSDYAHKLASINADAVARLVSVIEEQKLGTAEGDPDGIRKIVFTPAEVSKLKNTAQAALNDAWDIGVQHAERELGKAKADKAKMTATGAQQTFAVNKAALEELASKYLKARSYTLAGDISAATQKTIQNILSEGTKTSKTTKQVKDEIYKALEADGMLTEEAVAEALGANTVKNASARIETAIRTTTFEAINEARYDFYTDPDLAGFVVALEYSAIMDDRTTEICSQLNGETYGIDSEVWSTFRPPNHFNCRSLLIPITMLDTWAESSPPTVQPQKGFGFSKIGGGA